MFDNTYSVSIHPCMHAYMRIHRLKDVHIDIIYGKKIDKMQALHRFTEKCMFITFLSHCLNFVRTCLNRFSRGKVIFKKRILTFMVRGIWRKRSGGVVYACVSSILRARHIEPKWSTNGKVSIIG